ncbi:MAG: Nif3-like dinuclear metal center hexameric protein [Planctomycetales bacterium]|nr:Nif3-like dinuclear metal center hexameric protein [Planctomycetales bacterium]
MTTVEAICRFLETLAPPRLAEEWDNVGLLVGDPQSAVERVMTCLTVTAESAAEAAREGAQLIVTHHPLPFRPLKRITSESSPGRLLLTLIRAGVAVYSAHTAFDSALRGINQQLAEGLGVQNAAPLEARLDDPQQLGAGRFGTLPAPTSLHDFAEQVKRFLHIDGLHLVGDANRPIRRAAFACGSAGQFLTAARHAGCDVLVTGETSFHTCLEAESENVALVLPGHFASERFAMEGLAATLADEFASLEIWGSRDERDPLRWA